MSKLYGIDAIEYLDSFSETLNELSKHVPKNHFRNRRDNIIEAINQNYKAPEEEEENII